MNKTIDDMKKFILNLSVAVAFIVSVIVAVPIFIALQAYGIAWTADKWVEEYIIEGKWK